MRLLLDECLPRRLGAHFAGHHVRTVPRMGWAGVKNGRLLALAAGEFDAFVTGDQNLASQQPRELPIAVVVMCARTTRLTDQAPLVPQALEQLRELRRGELRIVGTPARRG